MLETLTDVEARVLGSLVEKQLTSPEYYPLTLNALTAACNQKSNRDPVVSYDDTTITTEDHGGTRHSVATHEAHQAHKGTQRKSFKYLLKKQKGFEAFSKMFQIPFKKV